MINPMILKAALTVADFMRPVVFAMIGGFVVVGMQRCQQQQPVTLVITNQQYEKQLSEIRANQDSLGRVLPTMSESLRYLSERYGKPGEK